MRLRQACNYPLEIEQKQDESSIADISSTIVQLESLDLNNPRPENRQKHSSKILKVKIF